jgi:DNA-binding IclR family transcriptional regulator
VTDVYALRRELDEISEHGWAGEVGELYERPRRIAAPIEDGRRVTVGAMGLTGPVERLCEDSRPRPELVRYVTTSARAVSRELGAIPW